MHSIIAFAKHESGHDQRYFVSERNQRHFITITTIFPKQTVLVNEPNENDTFLMSPSNIYSFYFGIIPHHQQLSVLHNHIQIAVQKLFNRIKLMTTLLN